MKIKEFQESFNNKLKDYSKKLHFSIPKEFLNDFYINDFRGTIPDKDTKTGDNVIGSGKNGVVYNVIYYGDKIEKQNYVAKELIGAFSQEYIDCVTKELLYHYVMHSVNECTPKIYGIVFEVDCHRDINRMLMLIQKIEGEFVRKYYIHESRKTDPSLDEEKKNIIKQLFKYNWIKNLVFIQHGDLHSENMIIDIKTKQLYIIDYGMSSLSLEKDKTTVFSNWKIIPDDGFGGDTYYIGCIIEIFFIERGDLFSQEYCEQIEILEKDKPNNCKWLGLLGKFYTKNDLRKFIFEIIQIPVPTELLKSTFGFDFGPTMFEKIGLEDLDLIMFITKYFNILNMLYQFYTKDQGKDTALFKKKVKEIEYFYDIFLLFVTCDSSVDSSIIFNFGPDFYFPQFEYSLKVEGIDISYPENTPNEFVDQINSFKEKKFNFDINKFKNKSLKSIFIYFKKASLQFFNIFLEKIKINNIVIEYDSSSDDIAHVPKEDENGLTFNSMAEYFFINETKKEFLDEDIDYIKDFGLESLDSKVNYLLRIWNGHLFYSLIRFNENKKLELYIDIEAIFDTIIYDTDLEIKQSK
ncbi:hypothetical protein ACTFIW_013254 [Dictyostelium discoideum]